MLFHRYGTGLVDFFFLGARVAHGLFLLTTTGPLVDVTGNTIGSLVQTALSAAHGQLSPTRHWNECDSAHLRMKTLQ